MELLHQEIIISLVMFMISSFWVCRAVDCGGSQISSTIVVDQSGKSEFQTIQAAIDSIQENNDRWIKIHINPGTYKERVEIPYEKPCIFLEGQGRDVTTITYNDHGAPNTSATFSSFPNNVAASGITFANSFNIATTLNLPLEGKIYGTRVPALAAAIYGDKSAFYSCGFVGFQDTLWDVEGRHYFNNCLIEGAIDFIFGNGQSYYEECVIKATSPGSITAQGRGSDSETSGFVFEGGSVIGSGNGTSLLGRAYGRCSRVIFYKTDMSGVVDPKGWDGWSYAQNTNCLFYCEVECTGPGAQTSQRVLLRNISTTAEIKEQFSKSAFIDQDGWLSELPFKINPSLYSNKLSTD